jgi:hypothetical protein
VDAQVRDVDGDGLAPSTLLVVEVLLRARPRIHGRPNPDPPDRGRREEVPRRHMDVAGFLDHGVPLEVLPD